MTANDSPDAVHRRTLTVDEVAEILCIARNGVNELIHSGRLVSFRVGRQFRITPQALDACMLLA